MTEKRFSHKDKSLYIDNDYFCELEDGNEITELLNRQQYTVETVWKENEQLQKEFNSCSHNWALMYDEAKNKVEELSKENEQLKHKNKTLKNQYERKDRALKRTKKDIEKYTDYFMRELNWDCDRIIKEVFRW